eukprot:525501_1
MFRSIISRTHLSRLHSRHVNGKLYQISRSESTSKSTTQNASPPVTTTSSAVPVDKTKTQSDLEKWLDDLKLTEYAELLASNGYNSVDALRELTRESLDLIGVKHGHQRLVMRKLGKLEPLDPNVFTRIRYALWPGTRPEAPYSAEEEELMSEERAKEKARKKPRAMWKNLAAISPFVIYFYWSYKMKEQAREEAKQQIACTRAETNDIIKRTGFSVVELEEIQKYINDHFPDGYVNPENFAGLLAGIVKHFKEHRVIPEQHEDDDPADHILPPTEAQKLEWELSEWDLLCLYRRSPFDAQRRVETRELLVGLSGLSADPDRPVDKLALAWGAMGPDNDGCLRYGAIVGLIERLHRFGHFNPERFVKKVQFFPPKFEARSPCDVADLFFKESKIHEQTKDSNWLAREFTRVKARFESVPKSSDPFTESMSRDEFEKIAVDLSAASFWRERVEVWYLSKHRLRNVQNKIKTREKKREKNKTTRLEAEAVE